MASAQNYCDLSGFKFLTNDQKLQYKQSWALFNQVQSFNSNVSTLRAAGQTQIPYFQFINAEDKTRFTQGRFLHVQSYPNSNWDVVQQN
jgi:hypothetical protein